MLYFNSSKDKKLPYSTSLPEAALSGNPNGRASSDFNKHQL